MSDDTAVGKELPFELTAGGAASMVDLVMGSAFDDAMEAVSHDIDDHALHEELQFYLAAHGLIDETSIWRFDPVIMTDHTVASGAAAVPYDEISDGDTSNEDVFEEPVNDLVFSVLCDTLARGTVSEDMMLDATMDDLMRSKLQDAVSGRTASEAVDLADALDGMITNLLHDAFFGPEASKAVSTLAKSADDSQVVVDDYVQAVAELYDKFKQVRYRTSTGRTDKIDTGRIWRLHSRVVRLTDISQGGGNNECRRLTHVTDAAFPHTVSPRAAIVGQLVFYREYPRHASVKPQVPLLHFYPVCLDATSPTLIRSHFL